MKRIVEHVIVRLNQAQIGGRPGQHGDHASQTHTTTPHTNRSVLTDARSFYDVSKDSLLAVWHRDEFDQFDSSWPRIRGGTFSPQFVSGLGP